MQANSLTPTAPPKLIATLTPLCERTRAAAEGSPDAGRRLPAGLLLYGESAERRRDVARAIAREAGCSIVEAGPAEFSGGMPGQATMRVMNIFRAAKEKAPAILLINDLDAVAPASGTPAYTPSHNEIMTQLLMEQMELRSLAASGRPVLMVATTARPDAIDPRVAAVFVAIDVSQ